MSNSGYRFGTLADGRVVQQFDMVNGNGMRVRLMDYGATITEISVPDRNGRLENVTLGFDSFEPYLRGHPYFGSTIGRVANRIRGAGFELDGVTYKLEANNGKNTLHGGFSGWDKKLWKAGDLSTTQAGAPTNALSFSYTSPDGEGGFPGKVKATVTFRLNDQNELSIEYAATADKPTPVNLTNHVYFNLLGVGKGTILDHELTIAAHRFVPVNGDLVPTGEVLPVAGTDMDFTHRQRIGARIGNIGHAKDGYDHNYVLDKPGMDVAAAKLYEPTTGRGVQVFTTKPGIQFYSGNMLDGTMVGNGGVYLKHTGLCLETQYFPDSVHHPAFPDSILRPGKTYSHMTVYRFTVG